MTSLPSSLSAVGAMVAEGCEYAYAMKEFIDWLIREVQAAGGPREGFYPVPESAFADEPPALDNPVLRAHLAGMAEHLAMLSGKVAPQWTEVKDYFLAEPFFFGGRHARDSMLVDTPSAFRRRLLFCGRVLEKFHKLLPTGGAP